MPVHKPARTAHTAQHSELECTNTCNTSSHTAPHLSHAHCSPLQPNHRSTCSTASHCVHTQFADKLHMQLPALSKQRLALPASPLSGWQQGHDLGWDEEQARGLPEHTVSLGSHWHYTEEHQSTGHSRQVRMIPTCVARIVRGKTSEHMLQLSLNYSHNALDAKIT